MTAAGPLMDWEAVVAFALTLPGAARLPYYDREAVKVNGKAFVSASDQPGSFHVAASHDDKAVLLATDPQAFWQTPHFANWPGLLVRYGAADAERVRTTIVRGWWEKAPIGQRRAFGVRP